MIRTDFDFTTDSPGYWDDFWNRREGLGAGASDPDSSSPTLKKYHQLLWSKPLPNGQKLELQPDPRGYLAWSDFRLGSDSILVSFRYEKCRKLLKQVAESVTDYHAYVENYLRRFYTIGGMIIFPKHRNSMNQAKGCNRLICDRWDLTLECIRRYYAGIESPLSRVLKSDKVFFDLFVDFKGYVDFFFLQDCVSRDYQTVDIWLGNGQFDSNPLPGTVEEYLKWIEAELDFLKRRNGRIEQYCNELERAL